MTAAELRARLTPRGHRPLDPAGHRQAAVLVGLEVGRGVLLTRRAAGLAQHAGQVAFPGGKIEVGETEEGAALREAFEEVGLVRGDVEVLGRMDDYVTGTGFHVAPVVGLLRAGVELVPAADEVAAVFYLPFEVLLDASAAVRRRATFKGVTREFWVWPHEAYFIWGATAEILVGLARRLRGEA